MNGWRGGIVLVVLAAAIGWAAAPLPEAEQSLVRPRVDDWRLPEVPHGGDPVAQASRVVGAAFWGRGVAAGPAGAAPAAPPPDPRWRVAAVYGVGSAREALVVFAQTDRSPLRLRVGDKLPSGHTIAEIEDRAVCIRIGSKTYRLGVERSEWSS